MQIFFIAIIYIAIFVNMFRKAWYAVICICYIASRVLTVGPPHPDLQFTVEPPNRVDFINTKGLRVNCESSGQSTNWTLIDGSLVNFVQGLRQVSSSSDFPGHSKSILVLHPFGPENFRPDVHAAIYRCVASDAAAGIIYSRDVHIRGVVLQNLDVHVYDSYTIEGNPAVLKCHVPTVLSEYVKVVAWIKNDNLLIEPSLEHGTQDKYMMMPSGELHVRNVSLSDSTSRFKCKMINHLTGDTHVSSAAGQLFVTESRGNVSPRISDTTSSVFVTTAQTAVLACVTQGSPVPKLRWFKRRTGSGQPELLNFADGRLIETQSALLIRNVRVQDTGIFVCEANNEFGTERFEETLSVSEPIKIKLEPRVQVASVNDRISFKCEVHSQPIASVTWLHNGVSILGSSNKLDLIVDSVKASDRGMYQCVAKNDAEMVQASAELRLSKIQPQWEEVFQEVSAVKPGGRVLVKCAASGLPLPSIAWNVDGIELKNSPGHIVISTATYKSDHTIGTLELKDVRVEDGGLYGCTATNKAGKIVHEKRINVYGPLGSRTVPKKLIIAGSGALLNCPVYGFPIANISWEMDGNLLPMDLRQKVFSNGSLWIKDVDKKSDAGVYKCIASNGKMQVVEGKLDCVVMIPPKIVPFEFQDDLLREGMRARLQCIVSDGDIPLNITWRKDGELLSSQSGVLVRVLDEFSSILTIGNIAPSHNGKYTCVASNRAGTVTHSTQLSVNVRPKIMPFQFGDLQSEGSPARVVCGLQEGDAPIHFLWLKDDVPLAEDDAYATIQSIDGLASILSFGSLSSKHSGIYTCVARNAAGVTRSSSALKVNVPPRWLIQPQDSSVQGGKDILINCQATGFPMPTLSWTYVKDINDDRSVMELHTTGNVNVFPNGTLLIRSAKSSNEGFYFCKASNGVGIGLNGRAQVKILSPPVFNNMLLDVNSTSGSDVELFCSVYGDLPIKVRWFKGSDGSLALDPRYKVETKELMPDVTSTLKISKVGRADNEVFLCVAENGYGKIETGIRLVIFEKPDPPFNFSASVVDSRFVELTWMARYQGNSIIQKYIIQYKEASNSWEESITMETVNGQPKSSTITHLHPATSYVFRVFAENDQGRSAASQLLRVTTKDDVPSGPPQKVQVESLNTETFKVFWRAPEEKLWNGKLLGYYVGYKEVDTNEPYQYKTLLTPVPNADDLAVQIGRVKQFTKYSVIVQAYNGRGKGPQSDPVIIMTSEGAPSMAPTDVRCTTLTSQSIHVTWTAPPPESINGILRGYKVSYSLASDWFEDMAESYNVTLPTSLTVDHLEKFSNYSVQVLAMTKSAEGPRSSPIFCKTMDDVPGPPVDIKAIATSDDSVIVAWKPPDHPNGIIRSYSIYWKSVDNPKDAGIHTVPAREGSYEVAGLHKGHRFEFYVTASTMVGEGLPSRMVTQLPNGPKVAARIVSFEEKIIKPWKSDIDLACHAVGIPEPDKKWTFQGKLIDLGGHAKISAEGILSLKNVLEEDAGDYVCHVQNEYGEDKITYTVFVLAPPSAPTVEGTSLTSNSIHVTWKMPSGKMPRMKGYNLNIRKGGTDTWKEVTTGADLRSHTFTGLDCGTMYEITVMAINKIGTGSPSEICVVSTNGSAPVAPSKTDLIEETSTSIAVYLNTWKNGGCPMRNFMIEYAPKSSGEWTMAAKSARPEQRRIVISDLRPATWYSLRMMANNGAGSTIANYDFATLTISGATISPDVQSDAAIHHLDGLWTYLNVYVIFPVICTGIILVVILVVACICLTKSRNNVRGGHSHKGNCLSTERSHLKRADSSESFSYLQRGSAHRSGGKHKRADRDNVTPYETLNLTNQRSSNHGHTHGTSMPPVPPPLPPPRMEFHQNHGPSNPQPFFSQEPNNMHHSQGGAQNTFVFSNAHDQHGRMIPPPFPLQYPHEAMKACFE